MKKITELKEMQQILLQILLYLDQVCEKYGLKYFISDGTLLGAVRHKGFIPWDDDIDVWMPRTDYDKLAACVNEDKDTPYIFQSPTDTENFTYSYGKLVDTRTVIEEKVDIQMEMGLFIDVFPYDGLPDPSTPQYHKFLKKCMFLQRQRLASMRTWEEYKQTHSGGVLNRLIWGIRHTIGPVRISKIIDKNARTYPIEGSKMVGSLGCGYKIDQMMECEFCQDVIELEFEGHMLKAPAGYEAYLRRVYGDYMQLPPEEERVIHHMDNVWWK